MPSPAIKPGEFYQWSATHSPAAPSDAPEAQSLPAGEPPGRLTDRLNAKLSEFRMAGYMILWIEAPIGDLTTLLIEGGEEAIIMDPDPASDTAWFGGCKIRHSVEPGIRVFLEGEVEGERSCHIV